MKNYTNEDKICPHCGGNISGHCCGEVVAYWCNSCGSNNRNVKPNIEITPTK